MCKRPAAQIHRLHLTVEDQDPDPYYRLPFEVPTGITRLDLAYELSSALDASVAGQTPGNVVDLGLFDPRGCKFLAAPGFRGWSGSARSKVTLTVTHATPGYLPGPLYPGTWHVLLGLYQIAPEGCDVTVTIGLTPGEQQVSAPSSYASAGTVRDAPGWYRGDLHCHTHHSDASADVATLARIARAQGLDFLAITDHNTVSHFPELAQHTGPDLLLIRGVEVTTYRGHANVWGVRDWPDFRASTEDEIRRIRAWVREQCAGPGTEALFSINHPKEGGPTWEFQTDASADAVEAWQAPWWLSNYESLAFWDALLRQGKRPSLVGGSDKHQGPFDGSLSLYEIGTPTTWVRADSLSEEGILSGIRAGHAFVSRDPRGPRLELTARAAGQSAMMGDELHAEPGTTVTLTCRVRDAEAGWLLRTINKTGETGCVPIESDDDSHTWRAIADGDDYWRVEVIDPPQVPLDEDPAALFAFALSNPIYVRAPEAS